jgi:hypothetical protein
VTITKSITIDCHAYSIRSSTLNFHPASLFCSIVSTTRAGPSSCAI